MRAFNAFATHLWRGAHGYDRMKFSHDFQQDLHTILAELDSGRPFAFNRFADGELAILEERDIPTADGWSAVNVSDKFRERLKAALTYRDKDYYVGLGCPCCNKDEWTRLMELAGREPDDPQVTFSTLFVNGNWDGVIKRLRMGPQAGSLFSPKINMVNAGDDGLRISITTARKYLETATKPLFIAAGPATKIIIHELWSTGSRQVPLIDVGSAFDSSGRSYHNPNHPNRKKICQWSTT